MAGIAGLFGNQPKKETVTKMLETIKHRGPDSFNISEAENFCGGAVASDLSDERGNAIAQENKTVMLFDGEIYNQRSEGASDAEIALALYKEHGRGFGGFLKGVFSCAIYDRDDIILVRDGVGVRPLYFGKTENGQVCFASELKSLVGVTDNVQELLPGTYFSAKTGVAGYIEHLPEIHIPTDAQKAAQQLRDCLIDSVKKRMADGAVGACLLSGGLDSSIIAAIAHKINPDIPMITVGVEGGPDLENADIMAKYLGAKHETFIFDKNDIREIIPRAVYTLESFDEDCVSGTIANLFASQTAAKYTKCILSGEGGDELFGGYHLLKKLPTRSQRLKMMEKLVEIAYNTAVQRLDRSMMGNSINYRTPFIDTEVVTTALQIPVSWKIRDDGNGNLIEKWILREAFRDMLPQEIYQRVKLRFSGGTGTDGLMDELATGVIKDNDFNEDTRNTEGGYYLNTPKELWYYNIFKEKFPGLAFEKLVSRWDPFK